LTFLLSSWTAFLFSFENERQHSQQRNQGNDGATLQRWQPGAAPLCHTAVCGHNSFEYIHRHGDGGIVVFVLRLERL
jgi:hypothetical protein